MKKSTALLYIATISLWLINTHCLAQQNTKPSKTINTISLRIDQALGAHYIGGVALLNNGDTVRGAFEFNDSEENYHVLYHIDSISFQKRVYEPREIKILYLDTLAFRPVESETDGLVLMRIVLDDQLKVYYHKHFQTIFSDTKVISQFYLIKPNGQKLVISHKINFPFNARMSKYMKEDQVLYTKIRKFKYGFNDFYTIIEEYNNWLKQQTD